MAVAIGLVLVLVCLLAAVVRPLGLNEAVVALPCLGIGLLVGATTWSATASSTRQLAPTIGFLAAILVFARLCANDGLFRYIGHVVAHRSRGKPKRLLVLVVCFAAIITATLTLDATVVLVTPVVLATAHRLRVPSRPHSYACVHIANSGSLLLPVSNLTNLLLFSSSGLSFGRFAATMALPWVVACALDWTALRVMFRADLTDDVTSYPAGEPAPRYALAVLCVTVVGFVVTTGFGLSPAWAALAGCLALGVPQLSRRQTNASEIVSSAGIGFCLFVLVLAALVNGVLSHGVESALRHLIPTGSGLADIVLLSLFAAVLANMANNLPATLALMPLISHLPLAVLAVLVGVNIGPNATFPGSLATLLWRRNLPLSERPAAAQFYRLGLISTPAIVAGVSAVLWVVAGPTGLR
jgi:arsenical pump membrane protein